MVNVPKKKWNIEKLYGNVKWNYRIMKRDLVKRNLGRNRVMKGELLYPLYSVDACINEDLQVYPLKNGKPNLEFYSDLSNMASEWVGKISNDDDNLVSELIYWNERNG